jgi:hypothetical protein
MGDVVCASTVGLYDSDLQQIVGKAFVAMPMGA